MSDQLALFDYAQLEPEVRAVAIEAATIIRMHGRRAGESILAIGCQLVRTKKVLPHGAWIPWLRAEFGWSESSAQSFIQVADLAAKNPNFGDLVGLFDASALYLIARDRTPEPVRQAALDRAASGERVTHASVKSDLAGRAAAVLGW